MSVNRVNMVAYVIKLDRWTSVQKANKNSAEGVIAPAGAKVTGATIRMFISFLAVLTWKTGLKKM